MGHRIRSAIGSDQVRAYGRGVLLPDSVDGDIFRGREVAVFALHIVVYNKCRRVGSLGESVVTRRQHSGDGMATAKPFVDEEG